MLSSAITPMSKPLDGSRELDQFINSSKFKIKMSVSELSTTRSELCSSILVSINALVKLVPSKFADGVKDVNRLETDKGIFSSPNTSGCSTATFDTSAPIRFNRKAFDKSSASPSASGALSSKFLRGFSKLNSPVSPASKVRRVEKFENMPEAPPSVADKPWEKAEPPACPNSPFPEISIFYTSHFPKR